MASSTELARCCPVISEKVGSPVTISYSNPPFHVLAMLFSFLGTTKSFPRSCARVRETVTHIGRAVTHTARAVTHIARAAIKS